MAAEEVSEDVQSVLATLPIIELTLTMSARYFSFAGRGRLFTAQTISGSCWRHGQTLAVG